LQVFKPIEDLVPLGDVLVVELAPLLDLLDVVLEVRKTLVGLGVANAALVENGPARLDEWRLIAADNSSTVKTSCRFKYLDKQLKNWSTRSCVCLRNENEIREYE